MIQAISHKSVANANEASHLVREAGKQPLLLRINRHGDHLFVVVTAR